MRNNIKRGEASSQVAPLMKRIGLSSSEHRTFQSIWEENENPMLDEVVKKYNALIAPNQTHTDIQVRENDLSRFVKLMVGKTPKEANEYMKILEGLEKYDIHEYITRTDPFSSQGIKRATYSDDQILRMVEADKKKAAEDKAAEDKVSDKVFSNTNHSALLTRPVTKSAAAQTPKDKQLGSEAEEISTLGPH